MKKITILLCSLMLGLGIVGNAGALDFVVDSHTDVSLGNISSIGWTSLTPELSLSSGDNFSVEVGKTEKIDFFTLTATGFGLGSADVSATLAFDPPAIAATGTGDLGWFTVFGAISGGYLSWDNSTLPAIFNVSEEIIGIDFEEGIAIVCGQTATVHAYITNYGDGTVPVPEPQTMLMLGSVLLGLVVVTRKRFNDRS